MKRWQFSTVLAGVMLAMGAASVQAQPYPGRGPDGYGPPGHRQERERRDQRPDWRRGPPPPAPHMAPPMRHPGAGPSHNWVRGGYVPRPYRGYSYVVGDWRMHRLYAPPRGYQWIQYGGDYLLIAIGTGLIANIVFAN